MSHITPITYTTLKYEYVSECGLSGSQVNCGVDHLEHFAVHKWISHLQAEGGRGQLLD